MATTRQLIEALEKYESENGIDSKVCFSDDLNSDEILIGCGIIKCLSSCHGTLAILSPSKEQIELEKKRAKYKKELAVLNGLYHKTGICREHIIFRDSNMYLKCEVCGEML